jgi:hypothetical protein
MLCGMVDEDDVEHIALERAFEELLELADGLADPEMACQAWLDLLVAVLLHQQSPGRPLSWVMLMTLRRTIVDIRCSM